MLTGMATQNDTQARIISALRAPVSYSRRDLAANSTYGIIHIALCIWWIKKYSGQSVLDSYAVVQHTPPVPGGYAHAAHSGHELIEPFMNEFTSAHLFAVSVTGKLSIDAFSGIA
jgi:hypothetical protein